MDRRPVAIYFGGLLLIYLSVLFFDVGLVDHGEPAHLLLRVAAPLVELGLAFHLTSRLLRDAAISPRRGLCCVAAFVIAVLMGVVYVSQTLTLHMSDNFLTVLALENSAEGRLVRGWAFYAALGLGGAWTILFTGYAWFAWRRLPTELPSENIQRRRRRYVTLILLLFSFAWLVAHQGNRSRLEAGYRQAPLAALASTCMNLWRAHLHYGSSPQEDAAANDAALAREPYPFEKMLVYRHDLPFPKSVNRPKTMPNVIVIFTEGMSARLIGAYGGRFPGLTPNIDRLAARTMRIDNYYNHTAATYRGLQGQLTSGYPEAGGSGESLSWDERGDELRRVRYQSLPRLLRNVGYQSYFFSPHPNTVSLNDLLRTMGFDKVFSADTALPHSPDYAKRLLGTSLNDRDVFGELVLFLQQRAEDPKRPPVFIGTYNVGTHAFGQILPSGLAYRDGSNRVLNRFHNYDAEVGRFLDYFFTSPWAKDTVLIFTADHATYPEPPYRDVAGDSYKPYFVDRVPLLIYDPFHDLPASFDAEGNTSLALAPTLMQLLGAPSATNSFMGHTLFRARKATFGVAAVGQEFYATDTAGVYSEVEIPAPYRDEFLRRKALIELYYRMERENRIFPAH